LIAFGTPSNTYGCVGWYGYQRYFIRTPFDGTVDSLVIHVAVGVGISFCNHSRDLVSNRNQSADSVFHVLVNFIGARRIAEADYGAAFFVGANRCAFDNSNLVACVMVNQQRPAIVQAGHIDRAGFMAQNLITKPALDWCF